MKNRIVLVFIICSAFQFGCSKSENKQFTSVNSNAENQERRQNSSSSVLPNKEMFVSDEQTAINIALKTWIPVYGKEKIEGEKPFHANLKNGIWTVTGSLPEGYDGGVAEAEISQKDGKVLKVIHGQ